MEGFPDFFLMVNPNRLQPGSRLEVQVLEDFYASWICKGKPEFPPPTGDLAAKCASVSYTATLTFVLPYVRGN